LSRSSDRRAEGNAALILIAEVLMLRSFAATLVLLGFLASPMVTSAQNGAKPIITLNKATLASEVTTDQREPIVPEAGQKFLRVSTTLSLQQTIDLTKVSLVNGTASSPLIGVDSAHDGDPKQFSMTAPVRLKGGKMHDPLEETRSVGSIAFAFTPGKVANLKIIEPPQTFCLLFAVPQAFKTGQIKGLTGVALALPALTPAKP
jgi:hypothetical protein